MQIGPPLERFGRFLPSLCEGPLLGTAFPANYVCRALLSARRKGLASLRFTLIGRLIIDATLLR